MKGRKGDIIVLPDTRGTPRAYLITRVVGEETHGKRYFPTSRRVSKREVLLSYTTKEDRIEKEKK